MTIGVHLPMIIGAHLLIKQLVELLIHINIGLRLLIKELVKHRSLIITGVHSLIRELDKLLIHMLIKVRLLIKGQVKHQSQDGMAYYNNSGLRLRLPLKVNP